MKKLTITREEHRLGIDMFFHDNLFLVRWLAARLPPVIFTTQVEKHVLVALAFNAEGHWSWRKLASFAFTELKAIEAERELTPMEKRVRSIAEAVYDSQVKVADHFGIDVFPEDTDRAAARRELDERFQRALEELKPYLTKGEVQ